MAWAQDDFREARTRVVAALAARLRDLDLAEDAFADACAAAVEAWRRETPRDPAAWLYRVGMRKALDAIRRARTRQDAQFDAPEPEPTPEDLAMRSDDPIPDERLRLIFVCCHPAIAPDARAALTLKVVCGLSTERLARAFLTSEPAMLQRITRAKRKIRDAGVPFDVPPRSAWPERLARCSPPWRSPMPRPTKTPLAPATRPASPPKCCASRACLPSCCRTSQRCWRWPPSPASPRRAGPRGWTSGAR